MAVLKQRENPHRALVLVHKEVNGVKNITCWIMIEDTSMNQTQEFKELLDAVVLALCNTLGKVKDFLFKV
jgi:hypothetical protein